MNTNAIFEMKFQQIRLHIINSMFHEIAYFNVI